MHSVDYVEDNAKLVAKFWGVIADTYNTTTDVHHQWTSKNLKDHWSIYNKQVSLFNQIYSHDSWDRKWEVQNRTENSELERFH
jgi:hypothetical protein